MVFSFSKKDPDTRRTPKSKILLKKNREILQQKWWRASVCDVPAWVRWVVIGVLAWVLY